MLVVYRSRPNLVDVAALVMRSAVNVARLLVFVAMSAWFGRPKFARRPIKSFVATVLPVFPAVKNTSKIASVASALFNVVPIVVFVRRKYSSLITVTSIVLHFFHDSCYRCCALWVVLVLYHGHTYRPPSCPALEKIREDELVPVHQKIER
jgi:hypothetical protein